MPPGWFKVLKVFMYIICLPSFPSDLFYNVEFGMFYCFECFSAEIQMEKMFNSEQH